MRITYLFIILFFSTLMSASCTKVPNLPLQASPNGQQAEQQPSPTPTPTPSPSPTPPPPAPPKYFGYYASAMEGVGTGNYISELSDYSNFVFIHSANLRLRLEEAKSKNLKSMVSLSWLFFDSNLKLRPDYANLFTQQIEPVIKDYKEWVLAFYSLDEPYQNGLDKGISIPEMNNTIETMGAFLKSKFPDIPIAVILDTGTLREKTVSLPPSHDWFGFDCYDDFYRCGKNKKSIPQEMAYLKTLVNKLIAADGKSRILMAVPPSGYANKQGTQGENGVLYQLPLYKDLVKSEPLIQVVVPFIWQSFTAGTEPWVGTRELSRAKPEYQKFFQEFTK